MGRESRIITYIDVMYLWQKKKKKKNWRKKIRKAVDEEPISMSKHMQEHGCNIWQERNTLAYCPCYENGEL